MILVTQIIAGKSIIYSQMRPLLSLLKLAIHLDGQELWLNGWIGLSPEMTEKNLFINDGKKN
jgi:hypothetical protein